MVFGQTWVKIILVPLFLLKLDDVTVTLSLIVLSWIFLRTDLGTILLHPKISQDWMSSSWLEKQASFSKSWSFHRFGWYWWRHCDVSLIVLSRIFRKFTLVLCYIIPKFVNIECHFHGKKNRYDKVYWGLGEVVAPPPSPSFCLLLEPRRLVRSENFLWTDAPWIRLKLKFLLGTKALPIPEKNRKKLWLPPFPPWPSES